MKRIFQFLFLGLIWCACGEEVKPPATVTPEISITGTDTREGLSETTADLKINLSSTSEVEVSVDYVAISKTAESGSDFMPSQGRISIPAGSTSGSISIPILVDTDKEIEETFAVQISNPTGATLGNDLAIVTITDNDKAVNNEGEGYSTPKSITGYNLVWSDEFDGEMLDESNWTYELGNGCDIGLCGWGNNELQIYTDSEENVKLEDGMLTITAKEESPYSSARIITKGKKEFRFGRIDIRAKLPKGQGIWPAIWMLGSNIDDVSWPACGEIDIMELVGHQPQLSHGTAHWGRAGEGSQFRGNSFSITEDFSERFHVFTLLWKNNSVQWYVDETLFHTITPAETTGYIYPFNEDFFFIMNVAVGGNWPGEPDETTVFPQTMEVDYLRVFQEN